MTAPADRTRPAKARIAESHPEIAAQAVDPATCDLTAGSNKRVGWRCAEGHEWSATPYSRTHGTGCPYCWGRYAIPGETDLATVRPALAAELLDEDARRLRPASHRIVRWRCATGHEWRASICNRAKGSGCPVCSGRIPLVGKNDLATLRPDLARELVDVPAHSLSVKSSQRVRWRCGRGHTWETSVNNRASRGSGCPYCGGQLPIPGVTDLATHYPELASEMLDADPKALTAHSGKMVRWRCNTCRHEWRTTVCGRAYGSGCSACACFGYKTSLPGYVYLLGRTRGGVQQRKIGITNDPKVRVARLKRLGWPLLDLSPPLAGADARLIEQRFLAVLDAFGGRRSRALAGIREPGYTESWIVDSFQVDSIAEVLDAVKWSN